MEATANYDYSALNSDELSFYAGDVIKILNEGDKQWYDGELKGKLGIVPANYVTFEPPSWYMAVSKDQASKLIAKRQNHECNFLVRPSETNPGEMSLTVNIGDVQHFKILRDASGQYFLWSTAPRLNSINKLVEHYKKNSVSNNEFVTLKEESAQPSRSSKQVVALYNFDSRSAEELTIYENEIITVIEEVDGVWTKGSVTRRGRTETGLFPSNYVKPK